MFQKSWNVGEGGFHRHLERAGSIRHNASRGRAAAHRVVIRQRSQEPFGSGVLSDTLCELYPLHPTTIELLDEVRDRFSQTRGVVDFVTTQLGGSRERDIAPFLDREWGELVTPNMIVDHFEDVLQLQPEFLPISQRLLPWYERHLVELFDAAGQRRLAERLIRLLVVDHLAPSREGLTAAAQAARSRGAVRSRSLRLRAGR